MFTAVGLALGVLTGLAGLTAAITGLVKAIVERPPSAAERRMAQLQKDALGMVDEYRQEHERDAQRITVLEQRVEQVEERERECQARLVALERSGGGSPKRS